MLEYLKTLRENTMHIWVDADACPVVIKDILFKAAKRTKIPMTLVANRFIQTPSVDNIKMLKVPAGFDVADNEIVKRVEKNDLVIFHWRQKSLKKGLRL